MNDFLNRFQKTAFVTQVNQTHAGKVKVFFQLAFVQGSATLEVVSEKGEAIAPDYRLYQGETFNVLRMLEAVRQEQMMRISWGKADERVRLSDYPYLLFALLRCDNLVDAVMQPLKVSETEARIVLRIQSTDSLMQPTLVARTDENTSASFTLLSDVFALVENTIHPIASVGENYQHLSFFVEQFAPTMLEQYLSVFYSYVYNGWLEIEYVEDLEFMFFQVPQYQFSIKHFDREELNAGWLISSFKKISEQERNNFLTYIYK